jgi:hypothetical protein
VAECVQGNEGVSLCSDIVHEGRQLTIH